MHWFKGSLHKAKWVTIGSGVYKYDDYEDQRCMVCGRTRRWWK
jgi:hypothetical protein